jgi:hypothetical protein
MRTPDGETPRTMRATTSTSPGRSTGEVRSIVRETRRLVGLERQYRCGSCAGEHRSWTPLRSCPDCGERLAVAVIRRAALAAAG